MMFSYPYFRSPYYPRYSRYGYRYPNVSSYSNTAYTKIHREKNNTKKEVKNEARINETSKFMANEIKKEERTSPDEDSPLFQIFGIDLYFDDILIVCLIFFLYQEGVKDESLFIALILLLLS